MFVVVEHAVQLAVEARVIEKGVCRAPGWCNDWGTFRQANESLAAQCPGVKD